MNDQQIYLLMLKTPDIRAVQIADALDQELVDVSSALRDLVAAGDVVQAKGMSPNGHPAQIYNLSADFKKSKDFVALAAIVIEKALVVSPPAAAVVAAVAAVVAPVVAIGPAVPPVPPVGFAPIGTRVDRALAFITKNGSANTAQLRAAMGLNTSQAPSSFIAPAVKNGRIVRDGAVWKLGTGKPAAAVPAAHIPPAEIPVRAAPPTPAAVPAPPAAAMELLSVAPVAPKAATVYRCGLWSDGVLELQRDGATVARLTHADGEQMAGVIIRMLRDPLGTAATTV